MPAMAPHLANPSPATVADAALRAADATACFHCGLAVPEGLDLTVAIEGQARPMCCPRCQAVVRPDVVLFGEMLPQEKTDRLYAELAAGFDIVFSIGTSSLFPYISWPIEVAKHNGTPTVEINPSPTDVSQLVDIRLPLRAVEALKAIWREYHAD